MCLRLPGHAEPMQKVRVPHGAWEGGGGEFCHHECVDRFVPGSDSDLPLL